MSTVETIRFKLRDSITVDEFRELDGHVQSEYLAKRPGFQSRETMLGPDGEWLVIVRWASDAEAEAAIGAFFGAAETQEFISAVDTSTVVSGRYRPIVH